MKKNEQNLKRFMTMALAGLLVGGNCLVLAQTTIQQTKIAYSDGTTQEIIKNKFDYIKHRKTVRYLNGQRAIVNVITADTKSSNLEVKTVYGNTCLHGRSTVRQFVKSENAIAGVNGGYFKPTNGVPLGFSVQDGKITTGPIYNRVVFGITENQEFKMARIGIKGKIKLGKGLELDVYNINQPVFSQIAYNIYTDRWGLKAPENRPNSIYITVQNNRIINISNQSHPIPRDGFIIVGPNSNNIKNKISVNDSAEYLIKPDPEDWTDVKYAVAGGPYLVKEGQVFIDKQNFSNAFLWTKAPRTAVGYTKSGLLVMVTVDGRQQGYSEGATLSEMAMIMKELGVYNAMNLDGGTSTQMVFKGKIMNAPTAKGGLPVASALIVK